MPRCPATVTSYRPIFVRAVSLVSPACTCPLDVRSCEPGEDALANLSIEKGEDGTIQGHVRIRSKTQGIALSLGDKITLAQKVKV